TTSRFLAGLAPCCSSRAPAGWRLRRTFEGTPALESTFYPCRRSKRRRSPEPVCARRRHRSPLGATPSNTRFLAEPGGIGGLLAPTAAGHVPPRYAFSTAPSGTTPVSR